MFLVSRSGVHFGVEHPGAQVKLGAQKKICPPLPKELAETKKWFWLIKFQRLSARLRVMGEGYIANTFHWHGHITVALLLLHLKIVEFFYCGALNFAVLQPADLVSFYLWADICDAPCRRLLKKQEGRLALCKLDQDCILLIKIVKYVYEKVKGTRPLNVFSQKLSDLFDIDLITLFYDLKADAKYLQMLNIFSEVCFIFL